MATKLAEVRAQRDEHRHKLHQVCTMLETERIQIKEVVEVAAKSVQRADTARARAEANLAQLETEFARTNRRLKMLEASKVQASGVTGKVAVRGSLDQDPEFGGELSSSDKEDIVQAPGPGQHSDLSTADAVELGLLRTEVQLLRGVKQQLCMAHEQQVKAAVAHELQRRFPDQHSKAVVPLTVGLLVKVEGTDQFARLADMLPGGRCRVRWLYKPEAICSSPRCLREEDPLWAGGDVSCCTYGPCSRRRCDGRLEPLEEMERVLTDHTEVVPIEAIVSEAKRGRELTVLRFVRFAAPVPHPIETFDEEMHSESQLKFIPAYRI